MTTTTSTGAPAPIPSGRRGETAAGSHRLQVVIAANLPEELCRTIEESEPRVDVVRDHALHPARRSAAEWYGDPEQQRTAQEQQAYQSMVDSADVLFGLPDGDPAALARTVRANPDLRWVQTMAAGGGAQLRAAGLNDEELERLTVTTAAGVHGDPLAEFALFGVLAGAKTLPRLQQLQQRHEWGGRLQMRHLSEMTVLIVGLGGIGAACAKKFSALGARVLGTTRSGDAVDGVDELVPIDQLARAARDVDAIIVTLPGTDRTAGLIDERVLGGVREGTILVNVGRGTVVDEPALLTALDAGRIGFAALDVTATEPLPADSPLWEHPHVLLSPHTAALSAKEDSRIVRLFTDNLHRYLDGRPLRNVVDTVEFY
ncbi:D-2-hydroxyacid dehydrogenase [Brachybacterium sp. GCM10030252]|uniref:D-2-hydroxyacid dehydrogenase n=1 Tax=Brachybacterium sp. GCM10030252 TaxID=3273380 RepID=UPI00360C011C